jgi:hypothetical protein
MNQTELLKKRYGGQGLPKLKTLLQEDFERYKWTPFTALVPIAKEFMIKKWTHLYKQKTLASKWHDQWGDCVLTVIVTNDVTVLKGGIPGTNNGPEGRNIGDKKAFGFKRCPAVYFIPLFVDHLETLSRSDLMYPVEISDKAHNNTVALRVYNVVRRSKERVYVDNKKRRGRHTKTRRVTPNVTCLTVRFLFTAVNNNVPKGSFIFLSNHQIEQIEKIFDEKKRDLTQIKRYYTDKKLNGGSASLLDVFKCLVKDPMKAVAVIKKEEKEFAKNKEAKGFDLIQNYVDSFHLMRPIFYTEGDDSALQAITHYRRTLQQTFMSRAAQRGVTQEEDKVMAVEHLLQLCKKGNGLMCCSCEDYLHFCFCEHVWADYCDKKIITGYRNGVCPIGSVQGRRLAGAPAKSVPGGARTIPDYSHQFDLSSEEEEFDLSSGEEEFEFELEENSVEEVQPEKEQED